MHRYVDLTSLATPLQEFSLHHKTIARSSSSTHSSILFNEGIPQNLNRMENPQAGEVTYLHSAPFAIREDDLRFQAVNGLCKILPDLLRDFIFLFFETKGAAEATAVCLDEVDLQPGDALEDFKGRETDSERLEVARGKIGSLEGEGLELGSPGCRPDSSGTQRRRRYVRPLHPRRECSKDVCIRV